MKYQLRDDQQALWDQARKALRHYRALQIQACTGFGKTVLGSAMIEASAKKGLISGYCVHRKELLEQTANTFEDFGIPFGVVAQGHKPNFYKPVQLFSIDTLKNRLDSFPVNIDVLHIDESHHAKASGWYKVINHFKDKRSYIIGWSATPQRLDGQPLDVFDGIIQGPQPSELIKMGRYPDFELYSFPCEQGVIVKNLIKQWKEKGKGLKTIGFARSMKLAEQYAKDFRDAGIPSESLDSTTDKADRRAVLKRFATGEIKVIWNCRLFGEGYDIAANTGMNVRVGCVIDASPSNSLTDWIQRCGRVRVGGDSVLLDAAGNYYTHRAPCMDRVWTLDGREAQERLDGLADEKSRQCDFCHLTSKGYPHSCSHCGMPFPVNEIQLDYIDKDLEKIDLQAEREKLIQEQAQAQTPEELSKLEEQRGYKKGWSDHIERARKEKKEMQDRLFNLSVAMNSVGVSGVSIPTKKSILKLKPKELRLKIEGLEKLMESSQLFGGAKR